MLTSIVPASGATGITMALNPAPGKDKSLRRFANAALGKDKRAMSVKLSDFQTAWRERDVDYKRFLFMESSNGKNASRGNTSLVSPIKLSQRAPGFRPQSLGASVAEEFHHLF